MTTRETQGEIIGPEHLHGLPTHSTWPDCGATPTEIPAQDSEVSEDTRRVIAYSEVAGTRFIDRIDGESISAFRARIDSIMNTEPTTDTPS